jgi:hypothetical protein
MIEILLVLFTAAFIYLVIRFIKIIKNTRQDFKKENATQNIDLTSHLESELDSDIEFKE